MAPFSRKMVLVTRESRRFESSDGAFVVGEDAEATALVISIRGIGDLAGVDRNGVGNAIAAGDRCVEVGDGAREDVELSTLEMESCSPSPNSVPGSSSWKSRYAFDWRSEYHGRL